MFDIVALGESLIDFTPCGKDDRGTQLFGRNPGGAPANVLAMAARLGRKTAFIGKVGQDDFGDFLYNTMTNAGIDCRALCRSDIPTTLAFVQLDEKGDRSFTFYRKPGADILLEEAEVPVDFLHKCCIFHFGSVSLTDEPCRSATLFASNEARKAGALISFDPNYRPFLWKSADAAREEILQAMKLADLLKVNEEEMELLTGCQDPCEAANYLKQFGPKIVIITLGEKGAYYHASAGSGYIPALCVQAVDTTGAGDAFWGTFLAHIVNRNVDEMHSSEWEAIVRRSNCAGGLTATAYGAIPAMPSLDEIEAALGQ